MKKQFSDAVVKALGYYVYVLVDPRDKKIFYVGRGKGNRVFMHEKESVNSNRETDKLATIRAIQEENLEVEHYIVRHGLDRQQSLIVESVLINLLTEREFNNAALLTNIQRGYGQAEYGIMKIKDIEQKYNAKEIQQKHKLLSININREFIPGGDLYEATRKSWVLSIDRASKCEYVLAEYRGLVRAVFKVNEKGWQEMPDNSRRKYFEGEQVTDPEITKLYVNRRLPKKVGGQANPIWYFDK